MHRCLSCNQTCSISSIFCDACRLSLLERSAEITQEEQPELVKAGKKEEGMVDVRSSPQVEAVPEGFQAEAELAIPAEKYTMSLKTSGVYTVEATEGLDEVQVRSSTTQATNVLAVALPTRRIMPRRVRRALLVFCIVGSLALLVDGVLLALSIMRHHAPLDMHYGQSGVIVSQGASSSNAGLATSPSSAAQTNHSFLLSATRLTFTVIQGQASLAPQTVTLLSNGQDMSSWSIGSAGTLPAWLYLSAIQGSASATVPAAFTVSAQPAHLAPGSYTATLLVKAFDSHGRVLAGSPETLVVALNVRVPCTLSVAPTKLSFASVLLAAPAAQTLTLQESPSCSFPVYWQASADASWVTFSRSSGTDTDVGSSIIVQASSAGQLIGSYTAHITLLATDSFGAPVRVSPAMITVTLTVIG